MDQRMICSGKYLGRTRAWELIPCFQLLNSARSQRNTPHSYPIFVPPRIWTDSNSWNRKFRDPPSSWWEGSRWAVHKMNSRSLLLVTVELTFSIVCVCTSLTKIYETQNMANKEDFVSGVYGALAWCHIGVPWFMTSDEKKENSPRRITLNLFHGSLVRDS